MASRGLRSTMLVVHLLCSIGWIGAALAYLVLGLTASASGDRDIYVSMWTGMEKVGWWALVPLAVGSLTTGVILALVTPWGLLKHYWVVVSLVTTAFATVVLVQHMIDVSAIAEAVRRDAEAPHPGGDPGHTMGGLVVLVGITILNVVKPKGLTRRGWRDQHARRRAAPPSSTAVV